MRVVAGSENSKDLRQVELDRHLEAMSQVIEHARSESGPSWCFTMVLRSAVSAPARALIAMKDELVSARVSAKAILAKLEPQDDLKQLFASLSELAPEAPSRELIRWARNPRLLEAHEQVTYGAGLCWSGDAMRRDADKRNALALFDADPGAAQLGRLAFTALWRASAPVPERHLVARPVVRPSGAYERAPVTALRPNLQGWPLVRH
jgi:hypothetical protein